VPKGLGGVKIRAVSDSVPRSERGNGAEFQADPLTGRVLAMPAKLLQIQYKGTRMRVVLLLAVEQADDRAEARSDWLCEHRLVAPNWPSRIGTAAAKLAS